MSEEKSPPTGAGEPLLTLRAAAAFLGIAPSTLQGWVWKKKIPYVKLGGGQGKGALTRFRPESLREWVAAQEIAPKETSAMSEVISDMCHALLHGKTEERRTAAKGLKGMGAPEAVPALIQATRDPDSVVRQCAVESLADISDPRVAPALTKALEHEDPETRKRAASALGTTLAPNAPDALRSALDDEDCDVREATITAIGYMANQTAVALIRPAAVNLLRSAQTHEDPKIRSLATHILTKLGR